EIPDAAVLARLRNDPRVLSAFSNRPIKLSGFQGRGGAGSGGGNNATKPKAPTNLSATANSSSQISIAWTDASDNETGFSVERCPASGCSTFAEFPKPAANVNTFVNTGLTAQTVYQYRVLVFTPGGT